MLAHRPTTASNTHETLYVSAMIMHITTADEYTRPAKTHALHVIRNVEHLESMIIPNERPTSQKKAVLRRSITGINTLDSRYASDALPKSHSHRRSWRRYRINIPDRTSSLSQRPKTTRPRSNPRPKPKARRPDSISLHNRSWKLFSSIDEMLALTRESPPPRYSEAVSRPCTPQNSVTMSNPPPTIPSNYSALENRKCSFVVPSTQSPSNETHVLDTDQPTTIRPSFNTVMSWTSDETRRREYAKIDRAYTGLRGWFNQIVPRAWKKCSRRDFFRGECDGDSVRRFRVSLPEKDSDTEKSRWKRACRRVF